MGTQAQVDETAQNFVFMIKTILNLGANSKIVALLGVPVKALPLHSDSNSPFQTKVWWAKNHCE